MKLLIFIASTLFLARSLKLGTKQGETVTSLTSDKVSNMNPQEFINFFSCNIKVKEEKARNFIVAQMVGGKKQWYVTYDKSKTGAVYVPGSDGYFHYKKTEKNPMACLGKDEFDGTHIKMGDFSTKAWGVNDSVKVGKPDVSLFIFYGNNQKGDWGSMNIDAQTMLKWANTNHYDVFGYVTNKHNQVTKESVATSLASFRKWFKQFLSQKKKHLIFTVSTHGLPYKYKNYDMEIQGEGILIGNDARGRSMIYKDKELMEDINSSLNPGTCLWIVMDTCFSGGLVNLWEFKDRLSKRVVLFSAANSEIVGWGGKKGGYLTRYFTQYARPGRYTAKIADDILEKIEHLDQDDFTAKISPQIKYSRPILAFAPFLYDKDP